MPTGTAKPLVNQYRTVSVEADILNRRLQKEIGRSAKAWRVRQNQTGLKDFSRELHQHNSNTAVAFNERFASQNHAREVATSARRSSIGLQIKEHFADGKWHALDTIANTIDAGEDHVRATLDRITWTNHTYFGCTAERKKVGTHVEYRIFKINKTISSNELIEKLTPIIEGLRTEGKKNMVTMSPQTVAVLAHQLQKLLDEWAE